MKPLGFWSAFGAGLSSLIGFGAILLALIELGIAAVVMMFVVAGILLLAQRVTLHE